MRELAHSASVSVPTLRHYFGRREDLVLALLIDIGVQGAPHLEFARDAHEPFAESIHSYMRYCASGFSFGLDEIHTLGLREGLRHSRIGPGYLEALLEPTLQSIEDRLAVHQGRGEMRQSNLRYAALSLLSPLLFAFLHQNELCGVTIRPFDIDGFVAEHSSAFIRAYAA
jgi:AcrR family transcriptional regulator